MDDAEIWNNVVLKYADCEGYDEFIEIVNKLSEENDDELKDLSNKEATILFGKYIAKYFEGLDGLKDKSFMTGVYKEMFVNAQSKVKVDENYTVEQTLDSLDTFGAGESDTITSTPEMRLTMQVIVGMSNYFDNIEENDETGLESLGYAIMLSSYLEYEASISPEAFGQLTAED
jgi:hypothetical protein